MKLDPARIRNPNKKAWFNPHKCLICGNMLDIVTDAHAEKHGYATREALIKSGKVELIKESWGEHHERYTQVYPGT